MKTKMKALIALTFGGFCIAFGLYYGVSGDMHSSISARSGHIARWEKELVKDQRELEAFMGEVEKLANKTDPTADERRQFGFKIDSVERMTEQLRRSRDMIEEERDSRKLQILITAGLSVLGMLAILFGVVLLRRSRRHFV